MGAVDPGGRAGVDESRAAASRSSEDVEPGDGAGRRRSLAERLSGGGFGAAMGGRGESGPRMSRMERRRERIRAEIERNRRGEYKVPTWVLAVALVAFVAGWAALIIFV